MCGLGLAVFFVALAALLGWPFAALVGLPMAIEMLLRRGWLAFVKDSVLSAFVISVGARVIEGIFVHVCNLRLSRSRSLP